MNRTLNCRVIIFEVVIIVIIITQSTSFTTPIKGPVLYGRNRFNGTVTCGKTMLNSTRWDYELRIIMPTKSFLIFIDNYSGSQNLKF